MSKFNKMAVIRAVFPGLKRHSGSGKRVWRSWILALTIVSQIRVSADPPDFNRDVRPILSDHCIACHGPDGAHREAELRLDSADSMRADRDGYAVVVPGDPDGSELMKRIISDDPDVVMPPPHLGKELTKAQITILRDWISAGADVQPQWAYVNPQPHDVPAAKSLWRRNWIDSYVLDGLQKHQLQPSPDADPATLVRRLHLDLTGLPPAPEVVAEFVRAPSEAAWQQLVDQLLQSDACAERLTAYWLDLVRYADTVGYHGDQDHNISPYRDWVIDAFADNMPFNQFTREQLAGDLLANPTLDQKIASGYNRLLQTSHEGGLQPKEYIAIYAADRVRNVSAVWMGATVGCAQCHDHKYDPYTQQDFYSLAAFFADLDDVQHFKSGTNSLPTRRLPEIKVHSRRERAEIAALRAQMDTATAQEDRKKLQAELQRLEKSARLTMISVAKTPREVRLLPRGDWLDESGPIVEPAVPEFLPAAVVSDRRQTRLDLANWLCDAEDGVGLLTARVFANRFWYLLFRRGLSNSLGDFGGQGQAPDHPELLDRLATEFVNRQWDVRHILRLIVNSRTYRQSSAWTSQIREIDPENRLLARQSTFRLDAETIRDSALAVAGLLVNDVGGPSVKPYQPVGYYRHLNFPQRTYKYHDDQRQWRRGLYVHWQRQFLHPMLKAFDAPSREECTASRPQSNTPLAALTLLNDPTFVEAARAFAMRLLTNASLQSDRDRIDYAMMLAVSRRADDAEADILLQLLREAREYPTAREDSVTAKEANVKAGELTAWNVVARAILNLDEAVTRN